MISLLFRVKVIIGEPIDTSKLDPDSKEDRDALADALQRGEPIMYRKVVRKTGMLLRTHCRKSMSCYE